MSTFLEDLDIWTTDLDFYRKKYNLTRQEAALVLEDKDKLGDKLRNFKRFEQFVETVRILDNLKDNNITGFAG